MPFLLIVIIAIAMVFDFLNGFHDSSNIVATMISSRAMSPRVAMGITAVAEFCGPFLFGVAVATTIGSEVVDPAAINSCGDRRCPEQRHRVERAHLVFRLAVEHVACAHRRADRRGGRGRGLVDHRTGRVVERY